MPAVVLPVLDEREALPWVLERMPAGYEPIVVDNGSRRRLRRAGGRARRAGRARAAARLRRRLLGGAAPPRARPSSASWTATRRSTRASCRGSPTRCSPGAATSCSAPARARRVAAACPRRERACSRPSCAAVPACRSRDLGPMRAARRERAARPRHPRPPLRLAAGDGAARRAGRLADRRGPGRLPAARRALEGDRHGARDRCARCATWPRCSHELAPGAGRDRQGARRRGGSRRGCARPAPRSRRRGWPRAALEDTLAAAAGAARPGGACWCSTARPAPGCRPAGR